MHPLSHVYLEACREFGLPVVEDMNGEAGDCAGLYHLTTRGGRRASAATAYLAPARRRANLHVETGLLATRIVLDGHRAVGVEVRRPDGPAVIRARRKVILSGGAINSPQLLMLSGIGPAAELQALGIAVAWTVRPSGGTFRTISASTTCSARACRRSTRCCAHGTASCARVCATS